MASDLSFVSSGRRTQSDDSPGGKARQGAVLVAGDDCLLHTGELLGDPLERGHRLGRVPRAGKGDKHVLAVREEHRSSE